MSTDAAMPLAGDFPTHTHDEWRELAAAVVNKAKAEDAKVTGAEAEASMRTTLPGGLEVDPLYLRPSDGAPLGVPGAMPFTRGRAMRQAGQPWDVRQLHDHPDAATSRAAVLDDLEHGVTSVWVHVGTDGIPAAALSEVLADVNLEMAPVVVSSYDAQDAAARVLREVLDQNPESTGNLGLDPIGAAARLGGSPDLTVLEGALDGLDARRVRAITVDARTYRDAGATAVEEVGYAVATGLAYVRALADSGVVPSDSFPHIEFRVSASQDQFLTIAALRALRRLWARVGEVLEVPEADRGARIHAVTSLRMFTRDDPWVNVLRSTLATFAASVGGAEAISVLPYDTVAGLPEKFSRRLARNTQIVLADESNIARVTDPAGGAWAVEVLTDEVAIAAWAVLQEVEAAGGIAAALADGLVAGRLEAARAEAEQGLANRRTPLTGVSMFPLVGETPLAREPRAALPTGGLAPHRDSEVWEGLRDRATALAGTGPAPTVVVAALGERRDFGARETFMANLLAAGGIASVTVEGTPADVAAEARSRHTDVVVLASSPKGYSAHAADAVKGLRDNGIEVILVAGRAKELGETAVDGEVRDGMDVVAFLDDLLTRLGAPAEGAHS